MPTTAYKGYSVPTTGTESGTWGTDLNTNTFAVIDNNLGGIVTIALTNVNVNLTAAQAQNLIVRFTGALSGNVNVGIPNLGVTVVENLCSGPWAVTIFGSIGGGTIAPQGVSTLFIFDAVNGARPAGQEIPSGTILVAAQTNAPPGFTKLTAHNDKALRVVSGAASSGGSTPFSTIFTGRTLSVANLPAHNHGVNDPGHSHTYTDHPYVSGTSGGNAYSGQLTNTTSTSTTGITIQNTGSGSAIDFAVQYVDTILIQRN